MKQVFLPFKLSKYIFILLMTCSFLTISTKGNSTEPLIYDEVVSLGGACQAAWQLKANGIRKLAYPFDWMVTPVEGLINFILYKGAFFLDFDKLSIVEVLQGGGNTPSMLHVTDHVYGITLIHDFLAPDILTSYFAVKQKYDNRIARFFNLLQSNKTVLFIRVGITRDQVMVLDNVLHSLYPSLSYTILATDDSEEAKINWELERVKNFYLAQKQGVWDGDYARWKEILSHFIIRTSFQPVEEW